jgi:hypothetical protein
LTAVGGAMAAAHRNSCAVRKPSQPQRRHQDSGSDRSSSGGGGGGQQYCGYILALAIAVCAFIAARGVMLVVPFIAIQLAAALRSFV